MVDKVIAADIVNGVSTAEAALILINENKRAVNELIDGGGSGGGSGGSINMITKDNSTLIPLVGDFTVGTLTQYILAGDHGSNAFTIQLPNNFRTGISTAINHFQLLVLGSNYTTITIADNSGFSGEVYNSFQTDGFTVTGGAGVINFYRVTQVGNTEQWTTTFTPSRPA